MPTDDEGMTKGSASSSHAQLDSQEQLQNQIQNISAKQSIMNNNINQLNKTVKETCDSVQLMVHFKRTLRKAFGEEKSRRRQFIEAIEQKVQAQNNALQNTSDALFASLENKHTIMMVESERNRNFTIQNEEDIQRLNDSVVTLLNELNVLKVNQSSLQTLVHINSVLLQDEHDVIRETKGALNEANAQIQRIDKMVDNVTARFDNHRE